MLHPWRVDPRQLIFLSSHGQAPDPPIGFGPCPTSGPAFAGGGGGGGSGNRLGSPELPEAGPCSRFCRIQSGGGVLGGCGSSGRLVASLGVGAATMPLPSPYSSLVMVRSSGFSVCISSGIGVTDSEASLSVSAPPKHSSSLGSTGSAPRGGDTGFASR
jgi:hypothetical protein